MTERTRYQERVIKRYYNNREDIALQRAQELITELYLAEGKKRDKHWKSLAGHLEALGVKPEQIERLIAQNDPAAAANLVKSLLAKA
jgi:heme oxygenase